MLGRSVMPGRSVTPGRTVGRWRAWTGDDQTARASSVKRWTVFSLTAAVCTLLGWLTTPQPGTVQTAATQPTPAQPTPAAGRCAYTLAPASEDSLLAYSVAHYLQHPEAPLLLDEPAVRLANRQFLDRYQPRQTRAVVLDHFAGLTGFTQARRVVVCPSQPRADLLQAACLAGVLRAPLVVWSGRADAGEVAWLHAELLRLGTRTVYAVGQAGPSLAALPEQSNLKLQRLADAAAVAAAHRRELARRGPIRTLVLTNPDDTDDELGSHSTLAPWLALERGAALLLTDRRGRDASAVVAEALTLPELAGAEALLIVGTHRAIPLEHRPNPAPGKDQAVAVEVATPSDTDQPITLAVGRLIHHERAILPLLLARARLWHERPTDQRRVLIAANSGGSLPLMETISRMSAQELRNAGYAVTARFEDAVSAREIRQLLPRQDIFLWEGHYRTLVDSYRLGQWTEALPPQLIVLQSCLALNATDCGPLLQRGAVAVVGSPSRVYSGSGSAFALALVDALIHDQQSLGGALRQAKNFLLCYAQLKRDRLGDGAKLYGSGVRAMWAFALWGDPTLQLPRPARPAEALPAVGCEVAGHTIRWRLPEQKLAGVAAGEYYARTWPNGRLAGLLLGDADDRRLTPMLFAEVPLPRWPAGATPTLTTRLPRNRWQFLWDARRRVGYLLVLPGDRPASELTFHVVPQ